MSGAEAVIAEKAWAMALDFLQEAERTVPGLMPRVATHSAYYAAFHAARAVPLRAEGIKAPTGHAAVVNRFGWMAKQAGDPALVAAARALRTMRDNRVSADYTAVRRPSGASAAEMIAGARTFLETCARISAFPPP